MRIVQYARFSAIEGAPKIGYDLTDTLTLNIGGRYSWDEVDSCGGSFGQEYFNVKTCEDAANLDPMDGIDIVRNEGEEPPQS